MLKRVAWIATIFYWSDKKCMVLISWDGYVLDSTKRLCVYVYFWSLCTLEVAITSTSGSATDRMVVWARPGNLTKQISVPNFHRCEYFLQVHYRPPTSFHGEESSLLEIELQNILGLSWSRDNVRPTDKQRILDGFFYATWQSFLLVPPSSSALDIPSRSIDSWTNHESVTEFGASTWSCSKVVGTCGSLPRDVRPRFELRRLANNLNVRSFFSNHHIQYLTFCLLTPRNLKFLREYNIAACRTHNFVLRMPATATRQSLD